MTVKKTVTDEQKSSAEMYSSVIIRAGAMLQAAEMRQKKGDVSINELLAGVLQNMTSAKKIRQVAKALNHSIFPTPITQTNYLRRISPDEGLVIPATRGEKIITNAKDVFPGWIDSDFWNWGADSPGEAKPKTIVDVYEMEKDGDYQELFGSLGQKENQLLTHEQIIVFCKKHPNWLHPKGFATFFLFKSDKDKIKSDNENDKYFVANANWRDPDLLMVHVYPFDSSNVWHAAYQRRLVVPRLTLLLLLYSRSFALYSANPTTKHSANFI